MSDKIVLGYWGIRGRGQPLRHLAAYVGLDFQEKLYRTFDEYQNDFMDLGDFPNLPYLIDGDFKISETLAIARYIVRRAGRTDLLGNNPAEEALMENFFYVFQNLFNPILELTKDKKVNDLKIGHFYKTKAEFNKLEKFLSGKKFSINHLTIVDFFVAEYSHYFKILYPEEFKGFKGLITIQENVETLPEVQAYYKREVHVLTPFLPPTMTAIPLFWPGTQPKVPPVPSVPLSMAKSPSKTSQPESPTKPQEPIVVQKVQVEKKMTELPPADVQQKIVYVDRQIIKEVVVEVPVSGQSEPVLPQAVDAELPVYETPLKVVIISGSTAASSPSNYFLQQLTSFDQPCFQFEWADISSLQMHNEDIDEQGTENVNNLRGQIYQANAVLIGVSMTHGSVSTALTNAYNWLVPVLKEKKVGLVSMECGQSQFRKVLDNEGIAYLKNPGLSVSYASFFDENGNLTQTSYYQAKQFLKSLAEFYTQ